MENNLQETGGKVKEFVIPIYISLSNILTWQRNKKNAKQLLGYLPIISAKDETEKKSSEFKILVRKTFHNSIKFLLEPLFENVSIDLKIDDKRIWFYPRISTVICDWPEACTFSLTYKSSNSNYPCHFCLVSKDNLANTCLRKSQAVLHNKENMKKYYDNDTTKEISLEPVYNYFWNIPDLNIYDATVPDRMYHLDLGLYHYQIKFTKELLSKSSINKFNRRIVEIPRHPGLKIFARGLQSIARLTANEFRDLMKNISELKFPKLHLWKYHIIDTIRKYGAINRYTTESLHKTYVKIPYRLSNKRDVKTQIMKIIRCRAIILQKQMEKKYKTSVPLNYTSKLFDFKFSETSEFCEKQKNNSNINEKMRKVLSWFSNIAIIMDTDELSNYQSHWMSDLCIFPPSIGFRFLFIRPVSDSRTCYVQTLLVTQIVLPNKSLHLALVQWYNFKSWNTPFVYSYPWLELVEKYNFIEIEVIEEIVHIVPRFDKKK
ncbi:hypothetical protein Glove_132g263 [Diversispora epigaea]|uniref:Glycogen debranching enzyme glucanotransferase domain-containing protein n=1 Tax=Diversispora epigaea TaxID=1348612 RepID=A0A397IXN4_9GLOM|nr:hypothetical protein Glove_132g263 [Diversispora epigaea]